MSLKPHRGRSNKTEQKINMIYINQIGQCELGRGETVEEACRDAAKYGFEVSASEVPEWRPGWPVMDGAVVWVDQPQEGYNRPDRSPTTDAALPVEEKRMLLKKPFRIEDNLHLAPAAMPALFEALESYVDWWSETTDADFDEGTSNHLHQLMEDAVGAMNLAGWTTQYEAVWGGDRYRCGEWSSSDGITWVGSDGYPIKDKRYQEANIDLKDGPIDGSTWQTREAKLFQPGN